MVARDLSEEEHPDPHPPSRYSLDRAWWWDGEQWQPIEGGSDGPEGEPEASPPPPRPERRLGPLIGFGAIFLALALIALGSALWPSLSSRQHPQGARTATPTAHASATPSAHPTARPSPSVTPSQGQAGQRYVQVVVTGSQRMTPQIDAVNQACGGQTDLNKCRSSLVGLQSAARDFRQALSSTPAPACLQPVDVELRQGLDLFDQGTSASIAGIDANDPQRLVDGMNLVGQANDHLGKAGTRAKASSC